MMKCPLGIYMYMFLEVNAAIHTMDTHTILFLTGYTDNYKYPDICVRNLNTSSLNDTFVKHVYIEVILNTIYTH